MYFPYAARLGMTLQSMEDREDLRPIKHFAKSVLIPFSISIIDGHKSRLLRWRGVCKSISGITPIDLIPHLSRQGKEEPLDRLFHAGGVHRGNSVEHRCGTWGSITTIPGPVSPIMLDRILPVRLQDNSAGQTINWITIYLQQLEMIKLLPLSSSPERPGIKLLELAAGKGAKSLFLWCDGMELDGMNNNSKLIRREGSRAEVNIQIPNSSNGMDILG